LVANLEEYQELCWYGTQKEGNITRLRVTAVQGPVLEKASPANSVSKLP